MLHAYPVDTGSNSGLSVLLKDTSTRAGIEPPALLKTDLHDEMSYVEISNWIELITPK